MKLLRLKELGYSTTEIHVFQSMQVFFKVGHKNF